MAVMEHMLPLPLRILTGFLIGYGVALAKNGSTGQRKNIEGLIWVHLAKA